MAAFNSTSVFAAIMRLRARKDAAISSNPSIAGLSLILTTASTSVGVRPA